MTLVSAGTCSIQAAQTGNTNYAAATSVSQRFTVTQASQTITFGSLSNQAYGAAPITVSATASSGLAVTFTSTTASVCTVASGMVTLVSAGTCTIQAAQAGNTNYAAATPVSQSFTITPSIQTITFGPLSNQVLGVAPITVSATSSSGLTVSFTSTTASVCTVAGATMKLLTTGTCTIQAAQAGNTNYAAATPVTQSFIVTPEAQTITFGALTNQAFGTAPFTVSATASSGLAVSFASTTPSICTLASATVTLLAVGTCAVEASQAGNSTDAAATPVDQSFTVTQAAQTIAFGVIAKKPLGAAPFTISATASSGLPVSFASNSGVCSIAGATVTLLLAGTCTIQATQAGNANYSGRAGGPELHGDAGKPDHYVRRPPEPGTGDRSGHYQRDCVLGTSVSFTSTTPAVCTVSGAMITLLALGPCTIQASQAGNTNYAAALPVSQTFTVTAGTLAIESVLNAGSYAGIQIASDECTIAFGANFSTTAAKASSLTLSRILAGASVTITDSKGATLTAPLFYVSPTQINFLVPEGLAFGAATVTVTDPLGSKASFTATIATVSPSLFTADSSGTGAPAAVAVAYTPGTAPQSLPVFNCTASPLSCTAAPIDLGSPSTSVYLELFGTGIRGREIVWRE